MGKICNRIFITSIFHSLHFGVGAPCKFSAELSVPENSPEEAERHGSPPG